MPQQFRSGAEGLKDFWRLCYSVDVDRLERVSSGAGKKVNSVTMRHSYAAPTDRQA